MKDTETLRQVVSSRAFSTFKLVLYLATASAEVLAILLVDCMAC